MSKRISYFTSKNSNTFTKISSKGGGLGQDGGSLAAINTLTANLIVLSVVSFTGTGAFPVISDSEYNTWVPLTVRSDIPFTRYEQMYYCINPNVSATHVFSANVVFGYISLNVIAFKSTGSPSFDSEVGGNAASGTSASVGSLTPDFDNHLFVTGLSANLGTTPMSINSGFTITDSSGFNGVDRSASAIAYKIQTVKAALNPQWTWTTASDPCFSMALFSP